MNFENDALSEVSQAQRTTCYVIVLYKMPIKGKTIAVDWVFFSPPNSEWNTHEGD